MLTTVEILRRLELALIKLQEQDAHLFSHDVSERAITHKLAEYLQPLFERWNVDCEYNRNGHGPKRVGLPDPDSPEALRYASVYPDIIVHKRGGNTRNLLIVEAKKLNDRRPDGEERDRYKLLAYARDLDYRVGVFLTLDTRRRSTRRCWYSYFVNGEWTDSNL